jgi:hypothetical protein
MVAADLADHGQDRVGLGLARYPEECHHRHRAGNRSAVSARDLEGPKCREAGRVAHDRDRVGLGLARCPEAVRHHRLVAFHLATVAILQADNRSVDSQHPVACRRPEDPMVAAGLATPGRDTVDNRSADSRRPGAYYRPEGPMVAADPADHGQDRAALDLARCQADSRWADSRRLGVCRRPEAMAVVGLEVRYRHRAEALARYPAVDRQGRSGEPDDPEVARCQVDNKWAVLARRPRSQAG